MAEKQIKCNKKRWLVNFYNSSLKYSSKKEVGPLLTRDPMHR